MRKPWENHRKPWENHGNMEVDPLVVSNNFGKWPFIVSLSIQNGDFLQLCLHIYIYTYPYIYTHIFIYIIYIYMHTYEIYISVSVWQQYGNNLKCLTTAKSGSFSHSSHSLSASVVGLAQLILMSIPILWAQNWLVVTGTWLLFSHIFGIIIPIGFHIFQRGCPTTNQRNISKNIEKLEWFKFDMLIQSSRSLMRLLMASLQDVGHEKRWFDMNCSSRWYRHHMASRWFLGEAKERGREIGRERLDSCKCQRFGPCPFPYNYRS